MVSCRSLASLQIPQVRAAVSVAPAVQLGRYACGGVPKTTLLPKASFCLRLGKKAIRQQEVAKLGHVRGDEQSVGSRWK